MERQNQTITPRSRPPVCGVCGALTYVDADGDRFTLYDEGTHGSLAVIQIEDGETGRDHEVYVDEQDARQIVAWLTERLSRV